MADFISGAIHHPGRMKRLAKAHGVPVHQEMERDKHSKNPSLRVAANLGLRLTGGDLAHHRTGKIAHHQPNRRFAHVKG